MQHQAQEREGTRVERPSEGFSIGVLAPRTGLTPAVLRTWENRFGFPSRRALGHRPPSVHRRRRGSGTPGARGPRVGRSLQVAIDSVTRRHDEPGPVSVHAALAGGFPELRPRRLGRRALVAASHAVEDEAIARGEPPRDARHLPGGPPLRRVAAPLGRDGPHGPVVRRGRGLRRALPPTHGPCPARCQLPEGSPLRREWTVVTRQRDAGSRRVRLGGAVPAGGHHGLRGRDQHPPPCGHCRRAGPARGRGAAGATPPADVGRLLTDATPVPATSASDVDQMWMRALARLYGSQRRAARRLTVQARAQLGDGLPREEGEVGRDQGRGELRQPRERHVRAVGDLRAATGARGSEDVVPLELLVAAAEVDAGGGASSAAV